MRGIAYNEYMMFLKRLFFHITTALITLFVVLLVGEWFVPGSVLPFINLVDLTIPLIGLLIVCVLICSDSVSNEHEVDSMS